MVLMRRSSADSDLENLEMSVLRARRNPQPREAIIRAFHDPVDSVRRRRREIIALLILGAGAMLYGIAFGLFSATMLAAMTAPIAILLLVAIWALPDMPTGPVNLIEPLFFAFVLITFIWPHYLAITLPGLPWITFSRLVGFPLALTFLISYSVSQNLRLKMKATLNGSPIISNLIAIFAIIQLISILFSHEKGYSIQLYVNDFINWILIFYISCYVLSTPENANKFCTTLWIISMILSIIGIWEYKEHHVLWMGHIPSIFKIDDPRFIAVLSGGSRYGEYRAIGIYTTALAFGEYFQLALPFVLHIIVTARKLAIRIAACITVPMMILATLDSGSRSGVLGLFMASLVYFLFLAILRWKRIRSSLTAPAIVLAYPIIAAVAIAATFLVGALRHKIWGGGEDADSNLARVIQYSMGFPKIISHPLGYGIGEGAVTLGFTLPSGMITIDTYYLLIALEYGVHGFVVYYAIMIAAIAVGIYYTIKASQLPISYLVIMPAFISLINFIITNAILSQEDNHAIIFMVLGLIVGLAGPIKDLTDQTSPEAILKAGSRREASLSILP